MSEIIGNNLSFAYSEHLGPTGWAGTLGSRFLVFHGDRLGALHIFLGATFYTISLHLSTSFLIIHDKAFFLDRQ
jgi:hypothetical protein